jgi:hypothetical protein
MLLELSKWHEKIASHLFVSLYNFIIQLVPTIIICMWILFSYIICSSVPNTVVQLEELLWFNIRPTAVSQLNNQMAVYGVMLQTLVSRAQHLGLG